MSAEVAATLAAALIGLAALVLNHIRERNPGPSTSSRLNTLETDVAALKTWKSS